MRKEHCNQRTYCIPEQKSSNYSDIVLQKALWQLSKNEKKKKKRKEKEGDITVRWYYTENH